MEAKSYKEKSNDDSATAQNVTKKEVSKELDVKCKELIYTPQYVRYRGAGTKPPVRKTVTQSKGGQLPQIVRSVVHAFARVGFSGQKPSVEQQNVSSFGGLIMSFSLHSKKQSVLPCHVQWTTKKKNIIYDVMNKLLDTMKEKGVQILFLVGDLPT